MKKRIAWLFLLIMVISLAACSSKENTPAATPSEVPVEESTEAPVQSPTEEKEPTTLSLWIYDEGEAMVDMYGEWTEAVHAQYPWITIETEVLPWDSGPEKFTVACATGTTPDLIFDGYSRIAPAVEAGLTIDVSSLLEKYADSFIAPQSEGVMEDGTAGFLTTANDYAYCLLVNMDLAERLGVADMLPEDMTTWSWDDLLEICRAAKAADPNVIPIDLFAGTRSSDAYTYSWFMANGVDLCNEDFTATAFNVGENREKAIEVLNFYKQLIDEGLTNSGPATAVDVENDELFNAGNMLFSHGGYNAIINKYQLQQDGLCVPFTCDAVAIPTKDGAEPAMVCSWGTYGYAGFKNNKNEEAILLVLDHWLSNPEYQSKLCNLAGRPSAMTTTIAEYPSDEIAVTMERGAEYSAKYSVSDFGILESWWSNFRDTFYINLQEFYVNTVDAGTMLDNWQAAADPVIAAGAEG